MPVISYADFSKNALYGPGGYYTQNRQRVGRDGADFFTASSVPLFPKLLAGAFRTLSQLHQLGAPNLIEVGNEPNAVLFPSAPKDFSAAVSIPLGNLAAIPDNSIVFSNELFDAQPFQRVRYEGQKGWRWLGLNPQEKILDLDMGAASADIQNLLGAHFPPGATLDISPAAFELLRQLCQPQWRGLFIAFDYGLPLTELQQNPRPTARAYHQHRQLSLAEALSLPQGSYDITHHVIWDHLATGLRAHGFKVHPPVTQESFFVNYASNIFPTLNANERAQLATLLHPAHMGDKFQVLIAAR